MLPNFTTVETDVKKPVPVIVTDVMPAMPSAGVTDVIVGTTFSEFTVSIPPASMFGVCTTSWPGSTSSGTTTFTEVAVVDTGTTPA